MKLKSIMDWEPHGNLTMILQHKGFTMLGLRTQYIHMDLISKLTFFIGRNRPRKSAYPAGDKLPQKLPPTYDCFKTKKS